MYNIKPENLRFKDDAGENIIFLPKAVLPVRNEIAINSQKMAEIGEKRSDSTLRGGGQVNMMADGCASQQVDSFNWTTNIV